MSGPAPLDAAGLRAHYAPLLRRHGPTYRAVDWGSGEGQRVRFRVLCEVGDLAGASVLDVGCGVGHLRQYLVEAGIAALYRGIDIVPEMVEAARALHPGVEFEVADAADPAWPGEADYVLASGIFAFADRAILRATATVLFARARKAMAFNCLSGWRAAQAPGEFHADPAETLSWCRSLSPRAALRHDYHDGDFTVYVYRAP